MLYKDYLKTFTGCPFCGHVDDRFIKEEDEAFLTYSIAPYHKHHMLVIPKRHVAKYEDLNEQEVRAMEKLLLSGIKTIKALGYENYTILLRNGEDAGKSVEHLHYHIVPTVIVGDLDHKGEERRVMTKEEIEEFFEDFKKVEVSNG
ncbi:MAG: HIT family protein [Patescibacteria group bacterium]